MDKEKWSMFQGQNMKENGKMEKDTDKGDISM